RGACCARSAGLPGRPRSRGRARCRLRSSFDLLRLLETARCCGGERQSDRQHGAGTIPSVAGLDLAAHRLDEALADREAEADAGAPVIGRARTEKALEQALQILLPDPGALVDHVDA